MGPREEGHSRKDVVIPMRDVVIPLGIDTTKRLMSFPKCRSVEVINNPARPGSNHREVYCINYS